MRGVILAGGFARRMMPSSKTINKHMMPLYINGMGAIPMIYFPINSLINSGVKDILIITSDESAGHIIDTLGDGRKFGDNINFTYRIQNMHDVTRPIGIAGALKLAESYTNKEKFSVILGDNFFEDSFEEEFNRFEDSTNRGHIFLKPVSDASRFGVASIDVNGKVLELEEKPKTPKSNMASTGLYLFDDSIYKIANELKISARKELEIVDIHNILIRNGELSSSNITNFWHDMGTIESINKTISYINDKGFKLKIPYEI